MDKDVSDYDVIMTGILERRDLNFIKHLQEIKVLTCSKNFRDAGAEFYGDDPAFLSGASGAGCSAAVYFSEVY